MGAMTLRTRTLAFAGFTAALAAANAGVLAAVYELSRRNVTASHHLMIPLVSLVLVWMRRDEIFASTGWAWRPGLGIILAGAGLLLPAVLSGPAGPPDALTWSAGSMIVMWAGGFLICYGMEAGRAALFPLLFLGFMIPWPDALLDGATVFLKTGSRDVVSGLFTLTGTPYHREGFVYTLPHFAIEIADECSGIRSSIALLLTSLLAGHMFLKNGWKKALLTATVLPLAVVKNGIRITSLTLLAEHVDPGFLTGQLHHEGGIVFFLAALALWAPVLALLARSEMTKLEVGSRNVEVKTT
jgi:exosortase